LSVPAERIRTILQHALQPVSIKVSDDSASHAGHAEARKSGGGHFSVYVVADCFAGLSRIQRHRMVNVALKEDFGPLIHALSIQARTPDEALLAATKNS